MADFTGAPPDPWTWVREEWSAAPPDPFNPMDAQEPVDPYDPVLAEGKNYNGGGGKTLAVGNNPPVEEGSGPTPAAESEEDMAVRSALDDVSNYSLQPPTDALPPLPPDLSVGGVGQAPQQNPVTQIQDWFAKSANEAATAGRQPEMPWDYMNAEEQGQGLAEMAARDPEKYATFVASENAKKRDHMAQLLAKKQADDEAWRQENVALLKESRKRAAERDAKVTAEAEKLSADGGWWDQKTGFQKFATVLSAVVGGLVSGRTGKPNEAMGWIENDINRHVAAQRAKLADSRSEVSQLYARMGDDFAADEAMRLAAWKGVEGQLMTEQMKFDPKGTTARDIAQQIISVRGKQAELRAESHDKAVNDFYRAAQFEMAMRKSDDEHRKAMAEAGLAEKKAAGYVLGGGSAKPADPEQQIYTSDQLKAVLPPGAFVPPNFQGTLKQYRTAMEAGKSGQDVTAGMSSGKSEEELKRTVHLPGPGNKSFIANGSETEIAALHKKLSSTATLTSLMDEAMRIRSGWTSDTAKSAEWQQLQANWAAATGVAKDVLGLGALSGPDMGLVNNFIGTDDPTQYRDPEAGILKARSNIIKIVQNDLHQLGGPKDWTIPYIKITPPEPTGDEKRVQKLLDTPDVGGSPGKADRVREMEGEYEAFVLPGQPATKDYAVPHDDRRYIENMGNRLHGKGTKENEKKDLTAQLRKLMLEGGNSGIRAAAREALQGKAEAGQDADSDIGPTLKSSSTTQEDMPVRK